MDTWLVAEKRTRELLARMQENNTEEPCFVEAMNMKKMMLLAENIKMLDLIVVMPYPVEKAKTKWIGYRRRGEGTETQIIRRNMGQHRHAQGEATFLEGS
eukprot:1894685-Amphidinium_carterae.2